VRRCGICGTYGQTVRRGFVDRCATRCPKNPNPIRVAPENQMVGRFEGVWPVPRSSSSG
jgi:hypothetical protein